MIGIYKITSPSLKVYIGQTSNFEKRKNIYKTLSCKGQRKLYNSLKKYGFSNHKFEIITSYDYISSDLLDREEMEFYDKYLLNGVEMLNLMRPGEKGNKSHSEETKRLIGEKNKKGEISQFDITGKLIKVWDNIAYASKILGIRRTGIESTIANRIKTSGGFVWKKGHYLADIPPTKDRKRCINRKSRHIEINRPIFQYDLSGNFIKEWFSITYAAKVLGLNPRCISSVSRGKTKQTGLFIWSKNKVENLFGKMK